MGKERFRKRQRVNPMSPTKLDEVQETPQTIESVNELLTKLQSVSPDDKASAACVIANLAADLSTRHLVLNVAIIRASAPLILDQSTHVRHCVSGCLRDISGWGEEACDLLIKADVFTPIAALLSSFSSCDWSKLEKSQGAILLDVLNILANVCECCETAVEIFNREGFIEILYPLMSIQATQSRIPLAAGQCLLAVTENNAQLAERLKDHSALLTILQDPMDASANVLMKAIAAAILYNVQASSANLSLLVMTIKASLERGLAGPLTSLSEKIARVLEIKKQRDLDVENLESLEKDLEISIDELSNIFQGKRIALELLANLCSTDDDDDDWEDEDDDDSSFTSETMETGESVTVDSSEVMGHLANAQLLPLITNHVDALDKKFETAFSSYKLSSHLPLDIHDIRCRALACVDNLVQNVTAESIGGAPVVVEIWSKLLGLLFDAKKKDDDDLIEASTSACRSLLDCLVRSNSSGDGNLPRVDTAAMANLCEIALESKIDMVKINIAKCTAFLATLLKDEQLVVGTTEFLIQMAMRDDDLRVCSEAIDSIIDVFGEDETDRIAAEIGLIAQLRKLTPRFKSMLRGAPKSENKMIASTCHLNLGRFIKYKEKRLS